MQAILYDYHVAQGIAERDADDPQRRRYLLVQSVFKKHGVTEAEFDSSMIYYNTHPRILNEIYTRLNQRFQADAKALGLGLSDTEIYAQYSQYGDTANVWNGESIMFIRNNGLDNVKTLTMQCDTTFRAGDTFRLNFMANFLVPGRQVAFAFLTVCYDNGKSLSQMRRLGGNYETSMELRLTDEFKNCRPTLIIINFFHQPDEGNSSGYLVLTRPSLLRMHDTTRSLTPVEVETPEQRAHRLDSLRQDSLRLDSLRRDNERRDSLSRNRLSPEEFRKAQPVEHRINVVKERPIIRRANPNRRRNGAGSRSNSSSGGQRQSSSSSTLLR